MPVNRSENMRRIRSSDTAPELLVRRLVYAAGYRYRLHGKNLPGKPDLVFAARQRVVFVHGCYWHSHGCKLTHTPRTNTAYWSPKLAGNKARDSRNIESLTSLGWSVLVIWECEVKHSDRVLRRVRNFLEDSAT